MNKQKTKKYSMEELNQRKRDRESKSVIGRKEKGKEQTSISLLVVIFSHNQTHLLQLRLIKNTTLLLLN